jgi:uncharacterized protein YndB with AHSA1/START domain
MIRTAASSGSRVCSAKSPRRVVHTEAFDPGTTGSGEPGEAIVTLTFAEEGGYTTVTTNIDFGSREVRDAAMATGMTDGMEMSYQLLDRLLTDQK